MLLQRIKVHNYRTYLDLDLDLSVSAERPLVLIGGANGGGKTTLFNAIAGALYGLPIRDAETFVREVNAGAYAAGQVDLSIELELWFSGQVLAQQQQYVLTRRWLLDSRQQVDWGVKLNMAGNVIAYGSATPEKERALSESHVSKIIKANLPKELSQYFLFDAMSAGEKLTEDQLGRVIRENIENVMGLRKYLDLGVAARLVQESWMANRLKAKAEREEYLQLTEQQRVDEARLRELGELCNTLREEQHSLRSLVEELRTAKDQESVIRHRLDVANRQQQELLQKEALFRNQLEDFVRNIEPAAGLPFLLQKIQGELELLLGSLKIADEQGFGLPESQLVPYLQRALEWLRAKGYELPKVSAEQIVESLATEQKLSGNVLKPWLESAELRALEALRIHQAHNSFPALDQMRQELVLAIEGIPVQETQIQELRARLAGKDYSGLQRYEHLDKELRSLEGDMETLRKKIAENSGKIHRFDLGQTDGPDPRYDASCRLKAWFEEAADELLKAKKRRIEASLRDDLNRNLAAYRDVIERVELSENLRNLTFRIFHKAGNEIYLGQLNAASKQVVIQVLLKALHESGDYDPPVMIDTVMGVLDRESRSIILQNYFPSLSHQTILLSTDSEIDPERDWRSLQAHVSRAWTLVRDREAQKTEVRAGYFGQDMEVA